MILIGANILLYAYVPSSKYHESAWVWLETTLSKPELVGLSWVTILAFLRIGTTTRILEHPFSAAEAAGIVSGWLERPPVTILNPGKRHWYILRDLMTKGQAHGPLITDAHLAALAIEHGADRDFTRFPGLRSLNPLNA